MQGMRWRTSVGLVGTLALSSVDCDLSEPRHPVREMAPFDLDCPREKLRYVKLGEKAWGVRGCGRKTKYIEICGGAHIEECRWVQN